MTDNGNNLEREAEVDERQLVAVHDQARFAFKTDDHKPSDGTEETALDISKAASVTQAKSDEIFPAPKLSAKSQLSFGKISSFFQTQLAVEEVQGTPFVLIPVIMIAGVASYFALPAEPAVHNIPVALITLLLLRWILRRASQRKKQLINAAIIFALAMGMGQWRTMATDTPMLGSEVSTNLTAQIRTIEQRSNGSVRYTLDVISTERPKLRYAPSRVRATTRRPVDGAQLGEGLRGYVRLRPPSGPVRPGGFDFAFNNYFQRIGANGFFLGQPEAFDLNANPWNAKIKIEKARLWLARYIRNQDQTRSGTVAAALITGDKSPIPEDVTEALRISGLAHILSISGLHMALVAGTIMFALRAILAISPNAAAHMPTKKYAALAGFVAIFIYLFLAGASVATQRSFIMRAVMLGALLSDRSALTMRNLAIAAIIVMLIAPETVLGPSFQMSFAATLALIAAYGAWTRNRAARTENPQIQASLGKNITHKSASFIIGLSMTSIIAGAATGVFAAYHFQRVAVLGLVGNLLAMPIVSIITMPSAILATLLIPVGLDIYVYALMNWSIEQVIQISTFVATHAPTGAVGAMSPATLFYLTSGMILLCLLRSKLKYLGLLLMWPAILAQTNYSDPVLVIAEDARQMALLTSDGSLAVNRARPNGFILEQWKAAYKTDLVSKPNTENGLRCDDDGYCVYSDLINTIKNGLLYIDKKQYFDLNSSINCNQYDIIILAFAPAQTSCNRSNINAKPPLIITAQELALYGSAEIRPAPNEQGAFVVQFALGEAARPWQSHRNFSRSARNLAPYQRSSQ